ncbi:SEL1-like repeat protein [Chthonobacter rhizosphaerae]|uniref:SEL1-like repeat protein n=1 Tax=Chthonobacter rhizosphaerae TaxID=2735553 RepID=UPI0015EF43A9|nr:SEL1-like repeat protein [Chthonobacter rhizosphaerae]
MARLDMAPAEMMAEGQAATGDILFQLGVMYATGRTVPTDLVAAHKWFNLAAQRGNTDAARYRREVAAEMTAAEVAAAQREAREWMSRV